MRNLRFSHSRALKLKFYKISQLTMVKLKSGSENSISCIVYHSSNGNMFGFKPPYVGKAIIERKKVYLFEKRMMSVCFEEHGWYDRFSAMIVVE